MIKFIKSRGFLLIIIVVLASIMVKSCHQSKKDLEDITRNTEILKEEVEKWKDESGAWRAKARTATGTVDILKVTHKDRIDSIVKYYDIRISNIKSSTSVSTRTNIDVSIPFKEKKIPESITVNYQHIDKPFSISNKWYKVEGMVRDMSVDLKIDVYDSISFVTYWDRPKWYKEKELNVEAKSYNPYTKVDFIENIEISNKKRPKFAIMAYAGVGLGNSLVFTPQVGIGIGYKLWEF